MQHCPRNSATKVNINAVRGIICTKAATSAGAPHLPQSANVGLLRLLLLFAFNFETYETQPYAPVTAGDSPTQSPSSTARSMAAATSARLTRIAAGRPALTV
jgi:hypothetical protein